MEKISALHASMMKAQRDELIKQVVAGRMEHTLEGPHIQSIIFTFYSQLAQLADTKAPGIECVRWSKEELRTWLNETFVPNFARHVTETYQKA